MQNTCKTSNCNCLAVPQMCISSLELYALFFGTNSKKCQFHFPVNLLLCFSGKKSYFLSLSFYCWVFCKKQWPFLFNFNSKFYTD